MKKIISSLISLVILIPVFAQSYDLKLNLVVGETYKHISKNEVTVKQTVYGQNISTKTYITNVINYKVLEETKKSYLLEVWYSKMEMTVSSPQGSQVISSEDDGSINPLSKVLGGMIDKRVQIELSKQGLVKEVQGAEQLFSEIDEILADQNPMIASQFKSQMEESYGAESFGHSINSLTNIFPKNEVEVGDKWVNKTNMKSGGSFVIETEFELISIDDNYIELKGTGVIQPSKKNDYIKMNGMDVLVELSGETNTIYKLDRKTGWVSLLESEQNLSGESKIKDCAQVPGGMSIPQEIKTKGTIKSN